MYLVLLYAVGFCRHNLSHSHASLLIEMEFYILMVSQRLGHDKVETTWRTYAHLYPDKEKMLAALERYIPQVDDTLPLLNDNGNF